MMTAPSHNGDKGQAHKPQDTDSTPKTNGASGHDARGRFTTGNCGGPGNPFARQVAKLRQVVMEEVSQEELRVVVQTNNNFIQGSRGDKETLPRLSALPRRRSRMNRCKAQFDDEVCVNGR